MITVHIQHRDGTRDTLRVASVDAACSLVEHLLERPLPPVEIRTETRA